ncbi:MAG: cupredoxin domain-containing protein [Oligoflexia bacterium]|nr:cupredoxin domain-containing protein [Oligoflexia bacterium]
MTNGNIIPPALSDVAGQVSRRGVQEVAVIATDLGFFPKTIFVTRDVPVRLFVTGASTHTLCIMMDSFQVRKQIRAKQIEEITFIPSTPGKYRFYCPVNGMEGSLVVKELTSDLPPTRLPASESR